MSPQAYFPAGQDPLLQAGNCTPLSMKESVTVYEAAPLDCTIAPLR